MWGCASALRLAAVLALVSGLVACKPDSGPVEVKYGREACEMCGMIISDPHYATEIRGGPDNTLMKFDDVGDAMNWLEKSGWGLAGAKEIWVMNSADGTTWLDARAAFYRPGRSPMSYGLGAVAAASDDAMSFDAMRAAVLKRGLTSRCETPDEPQAVADHDHAPQHDHEHDHGHAGGGDHK